MSRTPVIIPAFNAESHIASTLSSLPKFGIEPIVAINGERDASGKIAEYFGATVQYHEAQGKLPAIQQTLEYLGAQALEPCIILDADTRPIFFKRWHQSMLAAMDINIDTPVAVGGPVLFTNGGFLKSTVTTAMRLKRAYGEPIWESGTLAAAGPNMGLYIKTEKALKDITNLPHIWPGEDVALLEQIRDNGGIVRQSASLGMLALTPASESWPSVVDRIRMGKQESRRRIQEQYVARGAAHSMSYDEYREFQTKAVSPLDL